VIVKVRLVVQRSNAPGWTLGVVTSDERRTIRELDPSFAAPLHGAVSTASEAEVAVVDETFPLLS
jgi:hypothetical protein